MKIFLAVLLLLTVSCNKKKYTPRCALPGMSIQEVIARCGEPDDYEFSYDYEIYKYESRGLMTIGNTKVYFSQGIVGRIESSVY